MTSTTIEPPVKPDLKPTDNKLKEFVLPRVGPTRAAFLGQDSEPVILSKAIHQGIDIPGEVPAYLKKDRCVQEAALLKFSEAINASKDRYFATRDSNPRTEEKVAALQMARQFDLTNYSRKDAITVVTGSLIDSLQRMHPSSSLKAVGYVLEVAKELGIDKDVLSHPGLQRAVLYSVSQSLENAINVHKYSDTFSQGVEEAIKIAKLFEVQNYNKRELLDTIASRTNHNRQVMYHSKHNNLYSAMKVMTEELGISADFIRRQDVQQFGIFSVGEKLKTMASVEGKGKTSELVQDLIGIVDELGLLPERTKDLSMMLSATSNLARQTLSEHSYGIVNNALTELTKAWKGSFAK